MATDKCRFNKLQLLAYDNEKRIRIISIKCNLLMPSARGMQRESAASPLPRGAGSTRAPLARAVRAHSVKRKNAKPLFKELRHWSDTKLTELSGKSALARAIRYDVSRVKRMGSFLESGIDELRNNTTERSAKGIALGRNLPTITVKMQR